MATTTVGVPDPAPQQSISGFGRVIGVFFSPGKTFADIVRRPSWVFPMLLMTVIAVGLGFSLAQKADWVQVSKDQIAKNKFASRQIDQLPEDQKARAYEDSAKRSKVIREVRGFIGWPLLIVITAGIYFGAFKLLGGIRTNFKTAFAIATFAHLPAALRELLAIPVTFLKDPASIDPENFLASNPAAMLPDLSGWSVVPLTALDVFGIWCVVLLAIGFSAADPKKIPLGKSFGIVLSVWGSIVLFFTGLLWIFS
jgi:Yip1 domain